MLKTFIIHSEKEQTATVHTAECTLHCNCMYAVKIIPQCMYHVALCSVQSHV